MGNDQLLVFAVAETRHALYLRGVEKVEFAVELSSLPEAPRNILGTVNWKGNVLPALSMRRRLNLPDKAVSASDRLLIVKYSRRRLALVVDEVLGVRPAPAGGPADAVSVSDGLGSVSGLVPLEDGVMLIHDPELFLSEDDEKILETL